MNPNPEAFDYGPFDLLSGRVIINETGEYHFKKGGVENFENGVPIIKNMHRPREFGPAWNPKWGPAWYVENGKLVQKGDGSDAFDFIVQRIKDE